MHFSGRASLTLSFADLLFSPDICCLLHCLVRQLPVTRCFLVSEQNSSKPPPVMKHRASSAFLLPLVPTDSPLGQFLFISVIHVPFCSCFMNAVVFLPSSITLCFKAIWILLSNSVLFVLKPPLLQPGFFCHLSPPHKLCFCRTRHLWLHFITLFNYLTSIFYYHANEINQSKHKCTPAGLETIQVNAFRKCGFLKVKLYHLRTIDVYGCI